MIPQYWLHSIAVLIFLKYLYLSILLEETLELGAEMSCFPVPARVRVIIVKARKNINTEQSTGIEYLGHFFSKIHLTLAILFPGDYSIYYNM